MKRYFIPVLGAISLLIFVYMSDEHFQKDHIQEENKIEFSMPLKNEASYTEEVNQWLVDKNEARDIAESTKTPEKQAKEEAFWLRLISKAEAAAKKIEFYGKIVDQYGNPVPGVQVKYIARSEYLVSSSGLGTVITDSEGHFNTEGAKGTGLSIRKFTKSGYQFTGIQRFDNFNRYEDSVLWQDFTKDQPYIFKAWKVERYPETIKSESNLYLLTPDGRKSTFDILAKGKQRFKKGVEKGNFTISFDRVDNDWSVRLEALDGGVLETNDTFRNLAPESGYQEFVEYKFPINGSDTVEKMYYIKMLDGKYYGQMTIEFRAYNYRNGKAAVILSYVVNIENGRNLAVRPKMTGIE